MPRNPKHRVLTEELLQKYIAFERRMVEPGDGLAQSGLDRISALHASGEPAGDAKYRDLFAAMAEELEEKRRQAAEACGISLSDCEWVHALAKGVLRARRDPGYPSAGALPRSMRFPTLAELSGKYGPKTVDRVLAHEAELAELHPQG